VIDRQKLKQFYHQEQARFAAAQTPSVTASPPTGWFAGVPLHWMLDWPARPHMVKATGATLTDSQGRHYNDFCLGDSAAMFGHSPPEVVAAVTQQLPLGITSLLPDARAQRVAELLVAHFKLPLWQMTLSASDANRFALRLARAITGRDLVLVFEGCYHGAIEDVMVTSVKGQVTARAGLLGQVADLKRRARVVPFNDLAAVERALSDRKVACLMAEPVMTNCGMIEPLSGFWDAVQEMCLATVTPLLLDETHTLSSGWGGYCAGFAWQPDFKVIGKPLAGGLPAAVWGMSAAIGTAFSELLANKPAGHSGIGTTLSGNALSLAAMEAMLSEVMTEAAYRHMLELAEYAAQQLRLGIAAVGLPWSVCQTGARLEIHLSATPPRHADDVYLAHDAQIERALHLGLMNRGQLLTPFHNMLLMSKATTRQQVNELVAAFNEVVACLL
jgi:glutamate-1-semialdehyde 2,1-aminomutase